MTNPAPQRPSPIPMCALSPNPVLADVERASLRLLAAACRTDGADATVATVAGTWA
jgi:hypothetical protein